MSHRKAKKIRKFAFNMRQSLQAEPYTKLGNGQIIATENRRIYQRLKKIKKGRLDAIIKQRDQSVGT